MSTTMLERCTALLGHRNLQAFFHVIGAGESNEFLDDVAYRTITSEVGGKLEAWHHPWYGKTTTEVGHSTACGFAQFLGTSWKEASDALGLGNEFTPVNQRLATIWTIDVKRRALTAVLDGEVARACNLLSDEWVSLPGLGLRRAQEIFLQYGGTIGAQAQPQQELPTPEMGAPDTTPTTSTGVPVNPLIFLPGIIDSIPALIGLFGKGEKGIRNTQAAQVVVDAFKRAVPGAVNEQDALAKVEADPALKAQVKAAVMADPAVLALIEVGGGVKEARAADLAWAAAPKPFYKSSPVFWISMILLPMVVWYVGSSIAGGVAIPPEWPWYAQMPLKLLGGAWDAGARVGLANLVVGLVLGGICGVYFGVSVTQNNQRRGSDAPSL